MTRKIIRADLASLLALAIGTGSASALAQPAPAPAPQVAPAAPVGPADVPAQTTSFEDQMEKELGIAGGLTADDVASRAVATSYTLEARRSEVAAAAAEVDRAFAAYVPELTVLGRYTRLSDTSSDATLSLVTAPEVPSGDATGARLVSVPLDFSTPVNRYTLQASLLVPVSDYFTRVAPGHQAGALAESAARKSLAAGELATIADAKTTYYAWVLARLNVLVAAQALEDIRAHRGDAEQALAAGTASRADVLAIESRVADSERLLDTATNHAAELEEQLRILRHDPPEASYRVGERLGEDAATRAAEALPALVRRAIAERPEIEALELRARSMQKRASVERAGYYPRLDLFANAQYENPNQRIFPPQDEFTATWDAGVQVSWTLTDIPSAAAGARSQAASADAIRAERRALEDRVRREVVAAHTALLDARSAVRTSARSLAAAEEAYRVRRVLFQNGRATSVELLDAELDLTRARLLAVSARIDVRVARVRLDYATGRSTRSARSG